MKRGGNPSLEIEHARLLLEEGAEDVWGWATPAGRQRVAARVCWLTEVCGLKPGVRVLECGCGTGIFTRRLAATGANITAADISADLLKEARRLCTASNVTFIQADLENPGNLPAHEFDVLCGVSVLHHLDLPKALDGLKGKLRKDSRFAFSEPNLLNPLNKYLIFTPDLEKRKKIGISPTEVPFRRGELRAIFEAAGFNVDSVDYRDFLHPSVPEVLIPLVRLAQAIAERTPLVRCLSGSLWIYGRLP
jgi:SAM-dependent methyltransferase